MAKLGGLGDGDGDGNLLLIKWLAPMVVANFESDDPTNSSPHRYYCTTCYSVFFRKKTSNSTGDSIVICPNSSPNHHHLHKILQVYLASYAFCIRTVDIEALWNPSDICVYVINNHDIYFIQQKNKLPPKFLLHRRRLGGYCRICGYKLIQPHTSFCSIQCKLTDLKTLATVQQRSTIRPVETRRNTDSPADNDDDDNDNDNERIDYASSSIMSFLAANDNTPTTLQLCQSLRKRPRKSLHPQRSPLF